MATKTNILKKSLIEALEKSLGVVTTACKIVDCNRSTFYKYYNNDSKFKAAVDELQDMTLDFVESQLHKQIKNGNTTATIFYLKTKGKKRGFVERQEIQMNGEIESKIIEWTPAKEK
ncbi:MAG: hypothetical protein Unbinned96contig1002_39 [Prokaryotic dsDNA virus sp.]|nr:MAG: hypothetical protein Unbinned96contig1002_39 [Prokaryotic dsDNA virus sp.]|tara:strand:- start:1992 stop:2342 length:351 start_codon:yes stop_codon:yes gene_type:complete